MCETLEDILYPYFSIQALDEFASKLIENEHYAHDDVASRRDQLLQRRDRLYEAAQLRRHLLEESYKFQTFQRDCDETKSWINEKLKTASDENYLVRVLNLFPWSLAGSPLSSFSSRFILELCH